MFKGRDDIGAALERDRSAKEDERADYLRKAEREERTGDKAIARELEAKARILEPAISELSANRSSPTGL